MAYSMNNTTLPLMLAMPYDPHSNDTHANSSGHVFSLFERVFFGTWLSVSMIFAIFGNLMVIAVVIRHRGMRTRTNMFLVNLAIADFLVGILLAPFSLTTVITEKWIFGDILCFINSFFNATCLITSIQTLMYISIHKYLSISRPLSQITKCKILIMIGAAWSWGIICAALTTFILSTSMYKTGTMQCGPKYPEMSTKSLIFHFIIQTSNIFLPLLIMIVCYIRMFGEIKEHMQRLDENTALDRNQIYSQQRRVTITLLIVLSCFVLCWIPYCVYSNYVTFEREKSKIPGYANAIAYCFGYMNSACNPIIYAWRSPSFREGYKEILCQEPSYIVSDDTLHDSSPGPLRRLSTMIHNSFRTSNSRRNSEDSVHSLRLSRNSITSPSTSAHKLIRQLTSKTAKGSSLIRREGSIIMIKNGKIISMRRDPSFTKLQDDVFLPTPSDSNTYKINTSPSNHSTLNRVKEESFETEPLLTGDNSSQQPTTHNGHINHIDDSSNICQSTTHHFNFNGNTNSCSPRKKLTRMARVTSNSDENIEQSDSSPGISTSICSRELENNHIDKNGFQFPSSHQEYVNSKHSLNNNTITDLKRATSESNMNVHGLSPCSTSGLSKSVSIIYRVPELDSTRRQSYSLITESSHSDSNMANPCMPKYRQRWTSSKEQLKYKPNK